MAPEDFQVYILFIYSFLFLGLAVFFWSKKLKRSRALIKNKPCSLYLRMRFETSKLFDSKNNELALSEFASLVLKIRYLFFIKTKCYILIISVELFRTYSKKMENKL